MRRISEEPRFPPFAKTSCLRSEITLRGGGDFALMRVRVLKRFFSTALAALGLALSLYLATLKLAALPCVGGGGCGAVIFSRYGAVLGVPVGAIGALLWLTAIFVPRLRVPVFAVLAAGSVVFVGLQAFVLRAFCLWCSVHAVVTWVAFALRAQEPRRMAAVAGVALGLSGYVAARGAVDAAAGKAHAAGSVTTAGAGGEAEMKELSAASAALGPIVEKSPVLVLSLSCPACLDKLAQLTQGNFSRYRNGPALFWKTTDADRALTALFVAAVEAQGGGRDAFVAVTALVLKQRDLLLANPAGAATWLRATLPDAVARVPAAEALLVRQAAALKAMGAETTPLLIVPDNAEGPRSRFPVEEIFPVE